MRVQRSSRSPTVQRSPIRHAPIGRAFALLVVSLLGLGGPVACTPPLEPPALTRFQAAVDLTVLAARRTLLQVRSLEQAARRETDAYALVQGGPPRPAPAPALTPERLQVHLLLLDGLAAYAEALNRIAALPSQRRLPMDVGAVADRLLALTDAFRAFGPPAAVPPTDPEAKSPTGKTDSHGKDAPETPFAATRQLGQFLIVRHPLVEVPTVVRSLHPAIRLIVETLAQDLGPRQAAAPGKGSAANDADLGLRASLQGTLVRLEKDRQAALAALAADERLDSAARYQTASDMSVLPSAFERVDAALAALDDALRLLVAAHAKLLEPDSPAARWRTGLFYRAAALAADDPVSAGD